MSGGTIGAGGIGTLLLVLAVSCLTGTNPLALLTHGRGGRARSSTQSAPTGAPSNDPQAEFIAVVLADTEETWGRVFSAAGRQYREPVLVLFEDAVSIGVRLGIGRERAVLLPGRSEGVSRSRRSSASSIGDSARPAISPRPTSSRTKSATTSRTCLASTGRSGRAAGRRRGRGRTRCRCSSNCRRIASPACGDIMPARSSCSILATWTKDCSAAAAIGDDRLTQAGPRRRPRASRTAPRSSAPQWLRQGLQTGDIDSCDTFRAADRAYLGRSKAVRHCSALSYQIFTRRSGARNSLSPSFTPNAA